MKTSLKIGLVTCLIVLLGALGTASADTFPGGSGGTVDLTFANTGSIAGPYASVTLTNITGGVQVDVERLDSFLMRNFYLNTDILTLASTDIKNITSVTNLGVTSPPSPAVYTATVNIDSIQANSFGKFDISLTKTGTHNITSLIFDILPSGGATVNDFYFLSTATSAGNGQGHFAAEISPLGTTDDTVITGFVRDGVAVPEPGTLVLLGSGLLGLAFFGRKKFEK